MKRNLLIVPSILLATALAVDAQVVFDSSNYVTANRDFSSTVGAVTGTSNSRSFAAAEPASGYTGPDFFAAYAVTSDQSVTGLGFNRQRVDENGGLNFGENDFINIQAVSTGALNNVPANTTFSLAQAVFFSSASPFALNSFELSALSSARSGASAQTGRYMVEVGGTYYLSFQTINLTNTPSTHSYDFGGDLTWAVYNPTSSINFDQGSATFNSLSLAAVQGAGLYAENDSFISPAVDQPNYVIGAYQLGSLTAVPEPSAATLFGLGAGALVLIRRRRKN